MLQSNLDPPLKTKSVHNNLTELLPKYGNFWGHRFRVMNFWFTTSELTSWFYAYSFRVPTYLAPCANGCPKIHLRKDQTYPFYSPKSCGKFETFSNGLCMRLSFIAVRSYLCARVRISFWHLSLIPDVYLSIHDRWCAGMDSLELPQGAWFSCTFVGHSKGLWVRHVSRVLGTWTHDHRLSYGPPWTHYLDGYQDRLLGGPLGLPGLCHTTPDGVRRKDYSGEVLG
jgi:hypothetical protein